jgi:hypothetical protein
MVSTHYTTEEKRLFWSSVGLGSADECWEWQSIRSATDYGVAKWQGSRVGAHRVSFLLTNGHWPNVCRHTCDNPCCVNPHHLLDGTHADNARDRSIRGRHAPVKLAISDVCEMRASQEPSRSIARRLGVAESTVKAARSGRTWKYCDTPPQTACPFDKKSAKGKKA